MQLRKLIPAVTICVLTVLLSLTLFLTSIPRVSAADAPEPEAPGFNQSISGYLYGSDGAIYPYTCSMIITTEHDDSLGYDYEQVLAYLDLRDDHNPMNNAFGTIECYSKTVCYYPELDEYKVRFETREDFPGGNNTLHPLSIGSAVTEVGGIYYGGEVHSFTAIFLVDGQVVSTMTWNREQ